MRTVPFPKIDRTPPTEGQHAQAGPDVFSRVPVNI